MPRLEEEFDVELTPTGKDAGKMDDCYHKAKANDEPTFTIRAQDKTAPAVLAKWIVSNAYTAPEAKLRDALEILLKMREWAKHNKTKAAD